MVSRLDHLPIELPRLRDALLRELLDFDWNTRSFAADGLLEAFPQRFHEPYFRHYAIDDLDGLFAEADLAAEAQSVAFLSKVMVRRKV
jgi:hypothetical protein